MAPELNTRMEPEFRSGIVCLVGRPNVGKSTLLNRLVGKPVSITANKPQTTRNRIMGVRHGDGCQVVFVDTPGLHQAFSPLNRRMVGYALQALDDADLVVMVAEAGVGAAEEEGWVLERVLKAAAPKFLVLNKIDRVPEAAVLESLRRFGAMEAFSEWIPISALTGRGVERLAGLIERSQPDAGAAFITLFAEGDYSASVPLSAVIDQAILIYRLGDGPLPAAQGGPIRFLIPDVAACQTAEVDSCANVKFLRRIELGRERGRDSRPRNKASHAELHRA